MFDVKRHLRQMLDAGNYRVHCSETVAEAEDDLWYLFGATPKQLENRFSRAWDGNIHRIQHDGFRPSMPITDIRAQSLSATASLHDVVAAVLQVL